MTEAQRIMLFRLFSALAKKRGWGVAERDLQREKITTALFGTPRSWSSFQNPDVDRMKARLQALERGDDLSAQIEDDHAEEHGERRRLLHRIEEDMRRAGFNDAYVCALSRSLYDRAAWRGLDNAELTNLRDTIANRARAKAASKTRGGEALATTTPANPF